MYIIIIKYTINNTLTPSARSFSCSYDLDAAKSVIASFVNSCLDTSSPFEPSSVSQSSLEAISKDIRCGGGEALELVIREIELDAIGQDGMAADDVEKGGGR